jgi:hypothetical protein
MSSTDPFQDYLQTGEAAAFLGVHPSTLRHWHCDGLPAPPRIEISPHRYAYEKTTLAQWKASHEAASAPATPAATPAPAMPAVRCRTRTRPAPSNT